MAFDMRSAITLRRRSLIAAVLIGIVALATLVALSPQLRPPTAITIRRGACFGDCPIYSFTAYSNGRLDYDGELWVVRKGHSAASIDRVQYAALVDVLAVARPLGVGRFDVPGDKCPGGVGVDAPTAEVVWWWGWVPYAWLRYDGGCQGPYTKRISEALQLSQTMPAIERLIGTEAQRQALPSGAAGNPCREFDSKSPACRHP